MNKKSIVLFINTLSSGGAEHQLVLLADGLAERGYDVTITTFGDVEDHYQYSSSVHRDRIAPGKSGPVKMLAIWRYFFRVKADCVIGFGQRVSRHFILPLMLRSRKKVKAIAGERYLTRGKRSRKVRTMQYFLYRRADYIVSNSYAQRKNILMKMPQYEGKTITIINYTDTTVYQVTPLQNGETLKIGVFARYAVSKNCLRFVESIRRLVNRTQQKFVVEWYGNQHEKGETNPFYREVLDKVKEYGLDDYLVLNDHVQDVAKAMSQYDAIAQPSLGEGFSNAIGEAICCGKPCLVSDVSDNSVMVKDGVNGFLFDPQNEESIVEAFLKYFNLSSEEKQAMGEASRKRAEELFDRDRFVNAYVKLIG